MKALLLSAVLMHPLYTFSDNDPKTCHVLFPDTKGRACCDRAFKDHVGSHLVTEEEKSVLETCAGKKARK